MIFSDRHIFLINLGKIGHKGTYDKRIFESWPVNLPLLYSVNAAT